MFDSVAGLIITSAAALTALGVIWGTLRRAYRRVKARVAGRVLEFVGGVAREVIHTEVANGVSSRLDSIEYAVCAMREDTRALLGLMADHTESDREQFEELNEQIGGLREQIDEHHS